MVLVTSNPTLAKSCLLFLLFCFYIRREDKNYLKEDKKGEWRERERKRERDRREEKKRKENLDVVIWTAKFAIFSKMSSF